MWLKKCARLKHSISSSIDKSVVLSISCVVDFILCKSQWVCFFDCFSFFCEMLMHSKVHKRKKFRSRNEIKMIWLKMLINKLAYINEWLIWFRLFFSDTIRSAKMRNKFIHAFLSTPQWYLTKGMRQFSVNQLCCLNIS